MISVLVPAYNESERIEANLLEAVLTLSALEIPFELIVVDDGSADNTHLSALKARSLRPDVIRVVRVLKNEGKGNALMAGFRYCRGDRIVFLDADMDLHPAQIANFLTIMEKTQADVVVGSKRHPQSQVSYPRIRRIYSQCYYMMVLALFGLPIRDTQAGLKVFRTEVLRRVFPRILAKRFAFDIEVLANAHRLGYRIVEAPIRLESWSSNRVGLRDCINVFQDTLAIFYRMSILHYYDKCNNDYFTTEPPPTVREELEAAAPAAVADDAKVLSSRER
jgi:glycosyltransferase involved in cell wall biosynthesis